MSEDSGVMSDAALPLFSGPGEVRALGRELDWPSTPLGPLGTWPQSLKSTVRTLLASQYPMVLTWGEDFTQIYNDAYSKLIGDRHPAGLGHDIRVTLAEAWDTLGPMIERVMATGVANWTPALPLEMHRSGYREEAYFSVSHAPAEDDEGRIVGMLAVCSEVTDQVIGERRLRLLRELAASAGDANETGEAAASLVAAMALRPQDVPFALLYLREGDDLTLAAGFGLSKTDNARFSRANALDPDAPWSIDRAGAGETVTLGDVESLVSVTGGAYADPVTDALAMPIAGAQGTVLGALVIGVSPNRALDENYRSFCELLAGQVSIAIRNARAREDERRRAEELAELDRAKTAFFANVSHEFRTPLTLMLGPLEEALEPGEALPAQVRERVELAHRNSLRLLKLVNALLDFSRIEAGRAHARYRPTDLAELTADLAANFRSAFDKAGVALIVDCDPLPHPVFVDRDMWEKIVLNLLSNAFKFTFEGTVRVALRAAKGQAVLTVSDTGVGVAPDELPRLFERFHRVEGQRSRSYEGSGIGLALVQELVRMHGGEIEVERVPEGGTCFTVEIPFGSSHLSARQIAEESQQVSTAVRADAYVEEALRWLPDHRNTGSNGSEIAGVAVEIPDLSDPLRDPKGAGSVLVIDDNADMRAYIRRVLENEGYRVGTFADAETALEAIGTGPPPDLVLSDVMMPETDGFELLRTLRADRAAQALPVILVSARAGEEARVEGIRSGADDYLVKPFAPRELVARVEGQIRMARLRGEAAAREAHLEGALEAAEARAALREKDTQLEVAVTAGNVGTFVWKSAKTGWSATTDWRNASGSMPAPPDGGCR